MQGSQRGRHRSKNGFARDSRSARGGMGRRAPPPRPIAKSTMLRSRMRFIGSVVERSDVEKHEKKSTSGYPLPTAADSLIARTVPVPLCPSENEGAYDLTFEECVEVQWDCVYDEARSLSCPICLECPLYTAPIITHCGHVYCFLCWAQYSSHLVCETYNSEHVAPFIPFAGKVSFSQYQGDRAKPEADHVFPPLYPPNTDLHVTCPVCAVPVSALCGVRPFAIRLLYPHELTESQVTTDKHFSLPNVPTAPLQNSQNPFPPPTSTSISTPTSTSTSTSTTLTLPVVQFSNFHPPSLQSILSLPTDPTVTPKHSPNYEEDIVHPGLARGGISPFVPPLASKEYLSSKAQLQITNHPDFTKPKNPYHRVTFDTHQPSYSKTRKQHTEDVSHVALPQSMRMPLSLPKQHVQSIHARKSDFATRTSNKRDNKAQAPLSRIPFRLVVLSDNPERDIYPYRIEDTTTTLTATPAGSTPSGHGDGGMYQPPVTGNVSTPTHVRLVDPLIVPTACSPAHSSPSAPFFLTSIYNNDSPVGPSEIGTTLSAAYSPPTCVYGMLSLLFVDKSLAEDEAEIRKKMNELLMSFTETPAVRDTRNMQIFARPQWGAGGNTGRGRDSDKSDTGANSSATLSFEEKDPFVFASIDRRLDFQNRLLVPFQTQPPSSTTVTTTSGMAGPSATVSKPSTSASTSGTSTTTSMSLATPGGSNTNQEEDSAREGQKGGSVWSNRTTTMSLRKEWHRESYARELASRMGASGGTPITSGTPGTASAYPMSPQSLAPSPSSSSSSAAIASMGTWRDYAAYAGLPDSRIQRIEGMLSNTEELRHKRYVLGWCMAKYCELWRPQAWVEHTFIKHVIRALSGRIDLSAPDSGSVPASVFSPNPSWTGAHPTLSHVYPSTQHAHGPTIFAALAAQSQPYRAVFAEVLPDLSEVPYPPFFEDKLSSFVWSDRCSYFFSLASSVVSYLETMEDYLFKIIRVALNTSLFPKKAKLTTRAIAFLHDRNQSPSSSIWDRKPNTKSKRTHAWKKSDTGAEEFGNFFEEPLRPVAQEQIRQVADSITRWYQTFSLFYEVIVATAAIRPSGAQYAVPMNSSLLDGKHIYYQSLSGERCYLHPSLVSVLLEHSAFDITSVQRYSQGVPPPYTIPNLQGMSASQQLATSGADPHIQGRDTHMPRGSSRSDAGGFPQWDFIQSGLPPYILAPIHTTLQVLNPPVSGTSITASSSSSSSVSSHMSRFLPLRFLPPYTSISIAFSDVDTIRVGTDISQQFSFEDADYGMVLLSCPTDRVFTTNTQYERDLSALHNLWKYCFQPQKPRTKKPQHAEDSTSRRNDGKQQPKMPSRSKKSHHTATSTDTPKTNKSRADGLPSSSSPSRDRRGTSTRGSGNNRPGSRHARADQFATRNRTDGRGTTSSSVNGTTQLSLPTPLELLSFLDLGQSASTNAEAREILLQAGFSPADMASID